MTGRRGFLTALVLAPLLLVAPVAAIAGNAGAASSTAAAPGVPAAPQQYAAEISPVLELLAGVQTQTEWVKDRGPQGAGTAYYQALKAFFDPYRDDPAVRISAELLKAGFAYDAPVGFVCHLGPLPDLEPVGEYSGYIAGRAGGREKLEEFRLALKDLAAKSNFADFIKQWQPFYDRLIAGVSFDGGKVVGWLNEFSGTTPGEYHMLLAPSMFPGGGYGATVTAAGGRTIVYQIVRDSSQAGAGEPVFPTGRSLTTLALHEWGHSFVNPAVSQYTHDVAAMRRFYLPVAGIMRRQAYTTVETYADEQFLRAVTTLASAELYGDEANVDAIISNEESRGFRLTRPIYETLKEYRANRAAYPTFASFVPVVFQRISAEPSGISWLSWPVVAVGVIVVVAGVAVARQHRRTPVS